MQQVSQFLLTEGLSVLPEPLDVFIGRIVVLVKGRGFPLLDVDLLGSVEQIFHLKGFKDLQILDGNDIFYSLFDGVNVVSAAFGAELIDN